MKQDNMPKIKKNGKVIHLPYTKEGMEMAKEYHESRGKKKFKSPQSKWRYDMTGGRMM